MYKILLFIIVSILFTVSSFAQKEVVKVKKDIVYMGDAPQFTIELNLRMEAYTIYNLKGEKLIYLIAQEYFDVNAQTSSNPKGSIKYFDVTFMNENMNKCEIPIIGMKTAIAKEIIQSNLIKDGQLNDKEIQQYIQIHGTKYSDGKNKSTTIIINNN